MTFCRDETNKKELFDFLSRKVASFDYPEGKEVQKVLISECKDATMKRQTLDYWST